MDLENKVKVKILKSALSKSELEYAKDALKYINELEEHLEAITVTSCCKTLKDKNKMSFGVWRMKCKEIEYIDKKLVKYKGNLISYETLEKEYHKIKHTL